MTIIAVIDTETTGILDTDKLIELASVRFDTEGQLVEAEVGWYSDDWELYASSCFNPQIPIPPVASAIHHITDKDVINESQFTETHWKQFTNPANIIASHNWDFDKKYVPADSRPAICTWKCALRVWPDAPSHSNQALRYYLNTNPNVCGVRYPHRALYDSIVTCSLLKFLLKEKSIDELIAFSKEPALLNKIKFGKYLGKNWQDVPKDYLNWILLRNFDDNVKFTAKYWLEH